MTRSARADSIRERYVYVAIGHGRGPVKIGTSYCPRQRVNELSNCSPIPLSLVVAILGNRELEHGIHKHFEADRLHGEWFIKTPALAEFIQYLKTHASAPAYIQPIPKQRWITEVRVFKTSKRGSLTREISRLVS